MVTTMSAEPRNCVLIVEDNPIMADVLKRILLRSGLEGILARNGVEACDLILRQRFAVIVTDFSMPRMNGDEFVRNLRVTTLNCDVPVIFVSGKGLEVDTEQMRLDLGIHAFLFKPFSPGELIKVIHDCLKQETSQPILAVACPSFTNSE